MSAPIQRDDSSDDERFYAPPWARGEPVETHGRAPSGSSPPVAPGPIASGVDRPPPAARLSPFEGDRAVGQLRRRLTLEPELAPEPPIELRRRRMIPWPLRFVLVLVAAAAAAYGVAPRLTGDEPVPTLTPGDSQAGNQKWTLASVGSMPAPQARLVVEARQGFADEPLPMGISLRGAAGSQVVVLTGLAEGTRLTSGVPIGPTGWRLAAADLDRVFATPPDGFVGVMDLAVDLRSQSDALVDSQVARLEWVAKPDVPPPAGEPKLDRADRAQDAPVSPQPGRDEIATLVKRGFEFMKSGDLVGARLVLQRAANAGHAEAALTLGASYDPGVLAGLGVVGFAADVAQARTWYQKAQELGSAEASRRIEQLALAEKR